MKKIVVNVVIVASIAIVIVMFFFQVNQPPESIKKMIEDNKESYDWVADFYYKDFIEKKAECLSYSFLEEDKILNYENMSILRCIYLEKAEIDMFSNVDNSYYVVVK